MSSESPNISPEPTTKSPGSVLYLPRIEISQLLTSALRRYEIREVGADGAEGSLIALAQQKNKTMRDEVAFFADEARRVPLFSFSSRGAIAHSGEFDVISTDGDHIGTFTKHIGASMLRSTYSLSAPGISTQGQERSTGIAVMRRLFRSKFELFIDYVDSTSGERALTIQRHPSIRDRYSVMIDDPRIDLRLAAAMAIYLDIDLDRRK